MIETLFTKLSTHLPNLVFFGLIVVLGLRHLGKKDEQIREVIASFSNGCRGAQEKAATAVTHAVSENTAMLRELRGTLLAFLTRDRDNG